MNSKIKKEIKEWVKTITGTLVIALGISLVAQPTMVSGQSMYPTLEDKELLLVNKLSYKSEAPNRGDIIIFRTELIDEETNEKKNFVKRVIALPEEHLIIKDSKVYIDGELLEEEYLEGVYTKGYIDMIIPSNHIFTMGDNRTNSDDSRKPYIGTVDFEDIIGEAFIRVYPFNKIGKLN